MDILKQNFWGEIRLVPKHKLLQLYDFIHFFRKGLESSEDRTKEIMQFAGCWQDMKKEKFDSFANEITDRRQKAFSGRMDRDTIIS